MVSPETPTPPAQAIQLLEQLTFINKERDSIARDWAKDTTDLDETKEQLKALEEEMGTCPTCGREFK